MLQHRGKLKIYLQDFLIAAIIIIIHLRVTKDWVINLPCGLRLPPLHVYTSAIISILTELGGGGGGGGGGNVDINPHVDGHWHMHGLHVDGLSRAQLGELEIIEVVSLI